MLQVGILKIDSSLTGLELHSFGQTLSLGLTLVGSLISGTGPWLMEGTNQPAFFEPCNGNARLESPISSALALGPENRNVLIHRSPVGVPQQKPRHNFSLF